MSKVDELKKFKELLDQGIITEDEFQKKKEAILKDDNQPINSQKHSVSKGKKLSKNQIMIISILGSVVLIVALIFGGIKLSEDLAERSQCNAASEAIADIMSQYGLKNYKVKHAWSSGTQVLCKDFADLSDQRKLSLLKELDDLSDITVNDEDIDLSCDMYINSFVYFKYYSSFYANWFDWDVIYEGGLYKYDDTSGLRIVYRD